MKFDAENTNKYFSFPIEQEHIEYLKHQQIASAEYLESLQQNQYGYLRENMLLIQGKPYCLDCILGASSESICDLIGTNDLYNLSAEVGTVFAVLLGDDYLFFKPNDPTVYFCCRDTDEIIPIADSYLELQKKIQYEEK